MFGKHFNHALCVHKVALEALEGSLLEKFQDSLREDAKLTEALSELFYKLSNKPTSGNVLKIMENDAFCKYFDSYQKFNQSVREGHIEKTAQFWSSYIDLIWSVSALIKVPKLNDLELHISSLYSLSYSVCL